MPGACPGRSVHTAITNSNSSAGAGSSFRFEFEHQHPHQHPHLLYSGIGAAAATDAEPLETLVLMVCLQLVFALAWLPHPVPAVLYRCGEALSRVQDQAKARLEE